MKYLVTSNDWALAGSIYLNLLSKDGAWTFVNVVSRQNSNLSTSGNFSKKAKLVVLFGILGTIRMLHHQIENKRRIKTLPRAKVLTISHESFERGVGFKDTDFVVLVNYPWLIKTDFWKKILNFHPGPLPDYRGLMPICYQVLEVLKRDTKPFKIFYSLHWIDEKFDTGPIVLTNGVEFTTASNLQHIYECVYSQAVGAILSFASPSTGKKIVRRRKSCYFVAMSWKQTLSLKFLLLKDSVFVRFLINGCVIGVMSWFLQILFYNLFSAIIIVSEYAALFSVYFSFCFVLVLAFFSMKRFVFQRQGRWKQFLLSTFLVIFLVGLSTQFLTNFFRELGYPAVFDNLAYPLSAILFAPVSYALKNQFVFVRD